MNLPPLYGLKASITVTDGNTGEFLVDFRWVQEETSPQSDIINGHQDKVGGTVVCRPLTGKGCLGRTGHKSP